jgi:hypothetical protein
MNRPLRESAAGRRWSGCMDLEIVGRRTAAFPGRFTDENRYLDDKRANWAGQANSAASISP